MKFSQKVFFVPGYIFLKGGCVRVTKVVCPKQIPKMSSSYLVLSWPHIGIGILASVGYWVDIGSTSHSEVLVGPFSYSQQISETVGTKSTRNDFCFLLWME